jgi:hypothetical protein
MNARLSMPFDVQKAVRAVLLPDGWHDAVAGTFTLHDDGRGQTFSFQEDEVLLGRPVVSGPWFSVAAVRFPARERTG